MSSPFSSTPFGLILNKEKLRSGFTLTVYSPSDGLQRLFFYRKNPFLQDIQPLNLIEFVTKTPFSHHHKSSITDLSLIFSFSPPYMDFFQFTAIQNLLSLNSNLLFSHTIQETSKIFLLLLTFLQQSSEILTPLLSYALSISFFWKWMGITSMYNDIFYCHFCKIRVMHNPYTPISLWEWQGKFVCDACRNSEKLVNAKKIPPLAQFQFYQLLYTPFQELLHLSFQRPVLSFANQHLETFLKLSPKEALLRKNNPFVHL